MQAMKETIIVKKFNILYLDIPKVLQNATFYCSEIPLYTFYKTISNIIVGMFALRQHLRL